VQDKPFLSPNDIASELSVSASTVLRLIHEQRLPAIRVSERIYRIPVAAFERYKAGALESLSPARIAPEISKRPQIGAGEPLPEAAEAGAGVRSA
jgi:excisionase family DNA binding protein